MNSPKVFIGIITAEIKRYAEDLFMIYLFEIDYPNKEILIVDNSEGDNYANHLREYGIKVLRGRALEDTRARLIHSRNILRKEFLKGDCEFFFSLESDVLPPKDIIQRLMDRRKDIVSAIYCFPSGAPIAYDYSFFSDDMRQRIRTERCREDKLLAIKIAGLGAILIKREVIKKIRFRYKKGHTGTDDCWFSLDAASLGYQVYLDTAIKCKHYGAYCGLEEVIEFKDGGKHDK